MRYIPTQQLIFLDFRRTEETFVEEMVNGVLEVNLLDAKKLKDTDILGKMDPYVLVSYRGKEQKSKIARGQGSNPSWNQTFKFLVNSPVADNHHQHKIDLRIMDHDTFTADDFVGEATIFVGDVIAQGVEAGKGELRPAKYSVVLADRTYCGEIRVGVTFTRKVEEHDTEEFGGWKDSPRFA